MRNQVVSIITVILLATAFGPLAWAEDDVQLPEALKEEYAAIRTVPKVLSWLSTFLLALPPADYPVFYTPAKQYKLMNEMINHDLEGDARQFLIDEVINPLKETKKIELQDGRIVDFSGNEKLTDRQIAELLYYYVRDHVYFPHVDEAPTIVKAFGVIPLMGGFIARLYAIFPRIETFPCETVELGYGECMGKTMLLATLLKIEGFDVALGYFPMMAAPAGNVMLYWPGLFHSYVLLRDPGWGIGRQYFVHDIFGNPMDGNWIVLDSIYSPRHVPYTRLLGPHRVTDFGENPGWVKYLGQWSWIPPRQPTGCALVTETEYGADGDTHRVAGLIAGCCSIPPSVCTGVLCFFCCSPLASCVGGIADLLILPLFLGVVTPILLIFVIAGVFALLGGIVGLIVGLFAAIVGAFPLSIAGIIAGFIVGILVGVIVAGIMCCFGLNPIMLAASAIFGVAGGCGGLLLGAFALTLMGGICTHFLCYNCLVNPVFLVRSLMTLV